MLKCDNRRITTPSVLTQPYFRKRMIAEAITKQEQESKEPPTPDSYVVPADVYSRQVDQYQPLIPETL